MSWRSYASNITSNISAAATSTVTKFTISSGEVDGFKNNDDKDTVVCKALYNHYLLKGTGQYNNKRLHDLMPRLPDPQTGKPATEQAPSKVGANYLQNTSQKNPGNFDDIFNPKQARPTVGDRTQSADRTRHDNSPFGPSKSSEPPRAKGARVKLDRGQMRPDSARSASSQNTVPPRTQNSYGSSQSGRGGNYEDNFAPDGAYGGYSNGSSRNDKPVMAANVPWSSTQDEFSVYDAGYGVGQGGGGRPAPGSRGPGLPSGPRGKRY